MAKKQGYEKGAGPYSGDGKGGGSSKSEVVDRIKRADDPQKADSAWNEAFGNTKSKDSK
jgi:hypothetical protein